MNERLSKQVLINGGSDHLKSWFCMIVLASTINSKMILKPPPKYICSYEDIRLGSLRVWAEVENETFCLGGRASAKMCFVAS
ncbi:hypothetical protein MTR_4g050610 [Medicago truncatula]|uniref:Uncharacterized protein n=1 Tax=Medicago truncatula TaxID=3880 RepID=G7JET8_MEDTR|nr:hypothetical protein MTR_4g050610 [Medicago truncatula]